MNGVLDLPRRNIGGVPFRVASFADAVAAILSTTRVVKDSGAGIPIHFANAYTIALAAEDPSYGRLLRDPAAAVFTDGVPVTWVGRRAYPDVSRLWDRVYGPDVMEAVFAASGTDEGPSHYLLGGSPEALQSLRAEIERRWPRVKVVGMESPPYRPLTQDEIRERDARIIESGAAVVWVGLGTPKQDWEASRLASSIPVVALAVGAAFDFLSGTKPQAPAWMQRSGTEWTYRLASEPKRLAKRYLWGNPRFLMAAARQPGLRRGAGTRGPRGRQ